jgi:hypothetical protein
LPPDVCIRRFGLEPVGPIGFGHQNHAQAVGVEFVEKFSHATQGRIFTAHDEVVLTCPDGVAKEIAAWLKRKMIEAFEEVLGPELGGPKSVAVGAGSSWGECEEWDV